jgi:hypothetical protein
VNERWRGSMRGRRASRFFWALMYSPAVLAGMSICATAWLPVAARLSVRPRLGGYEDLWFLFFVGPCGVLCLVVGVGRVWRGQRRLWRRGCLVCRYDLTGNVTGVCPECGTLIDDATGGSGS